MAIEPETKNWTWVIESRCPECGFDGSSVAFRDVPGIIEANAAAWPEVLARPDVRDRPDDHTWSPLEYGAHVRDVHRKMTERLALVLAEDTPTFANWDQDATAVADDYAAQDPATVARELVAAADRAAQAFASVADADLDRRAVRSDGSAFTVATLATYYAHDPVHHLWDVRRAR
ncbi:methyltransferase type 12 [Curtobacterium sp. 'Ferrero']|uniref:DinB family protein n=1 Tax=Curtobacterium sp. 'Ferrero' TaxID=2033654 RepID=UPI000BCF86C0|nr:DinB family protein [Curtobacterium sp. 'Ferrero']PCN49021.1 methyltransferase type 12 [Curtobacterium sp. 'Ferrero']